MLGIFQYNTTVLRAVVAPDITSQQQKDMMGQDVAVLAFERPDMVEFKQGDYALVFGEPYTLYSEPSVTKAEGRKYQYKLTLEGVQQELGRTQFQLLDSAGHFTESKFNMRATPRYFLDLIIYNLNRQYPGKWSLGAVIDGDYKDVPFDGNNCLEVLSKLAEAYETEFLLKNNKIYLKKVNTISGITLKFGQDNGLYSITRQGSNNGNIVTRVYAYGSDRNIGDNYRGGAQRLRLPDYFIEKNAGTYPPNEITLSFPDIYPRREGVLSAVASELIFADGTIDFDLNDVSILIPGVTAKITFNSGMLQGYTFEINSFDNATKTFTINYNTDSQTITLPSTGFQPAVGDKYVLTDIIMPLSYINAAEAELKAKAQAWLDANSNEESLRAYSVVCDPIWFKKNLAKLDLAQSIGLQDTAMSIDRHIRVIGFTRNIQKPSLFGATLADLVQPQTLLVKLLNGL